MTLFAWTEKSRLMSQPLLGGIFILLFLSFFTGMAVNFLSPRGIALFGEWDTAKGVISARSKQDIPIHRNLEIHEARIAKDIFDDSRTVFVDARSREDYAEGHVMGAVSFPTSLFDEHIEKFIEKYPLSTRIVTYCSGRECEDSHTLARYFLEEGYSHVRIFIDGYPGWEQEGYPVEH